MNFLVGEWKGKGWQYFPEKKIEVSQTTKVKMDKDGLSLNVKTSLRSQLTDYVGKPFAGEMMIYYDDAAKLYHLRSLSRSFQGNPYEVTVAEPGLIQ